MNIELSDFFVKHLFPYYRKNRIPRDYFAPETIANVFSTSERASEAIDRLDFIRFARTKIEEWVEKEAYH